MRFDIHSSHRTILLLPAATYVVLVLLVAVFPAMDAAERWPAPPTSSADDQVRRGKALYESIGCSYCHTQQIRGDERLKVTVDGKEVVPVIPADRRFGLSVPSRPEDYAGDYPPLLGTQRTGPDLSNVGDRLPDVTWHYWHLYDPRAVSPDSVMEAYTWLFHTRETMETGDAKVDLIEVIQKRIPGGELWATQDAQDVAEYLISLRRRKPAS
jgi:cytochrome c oxidase cbb3-type subunit 2